MPAGSLLAGPGQGLGAGFQVSWFFPSKAQGFSLIRRDRSCARFRIRVESRTLSPRSPPSTRSCGLCHASAPPCRENVAGTYFPVGILEGFARPSDKDLQFAQCFFFKTAKASLGHRSLLQAKLAMRHRHTVWLALHESLQFEIAASIRNFRD